MSIKRLRLQIHCILYLHILCLINDKESSVTTEKEFGMQILSLHVKANNTSEKLALIDLEDKSLGIQSRYVRWV